jgi:hypothetical protein
MDRVAVVLLIPASVTLLVWGVWIPPWVDSLLRAASEVLK